VATIKVEPSKVTAPIIEAIVAEAMLVDGSNGGDGDGTGAKVVVFDV